MHTTPNRSSCPCGAEPVPVVSKSSVRAEALEKLRWPTRGARLLTIAACLLSFLLPQGAFAEDHAGESGEPVDEEVAGGEGVEDDGKAPATASPRELATEDRERLHRVLLHGRAYRARVQAAIMLGRRGTIADDLPVLRRAMREDSHYTVRGAAAMGIGNLDSPLGIEPLLDAATDRRSFVRRAARNAIEKLASDEQAIPYLLLARERDDPMIRMAAVNALRRMEHVEARVALGQFLGDRDQGVSLAVERAIGEWEDETEQIEALCSAVEHSSFRVRTEAARIAADYPHPRIIDALVDRLTAPLEEPGVQVTARRSLLSLREHLDEDDLVKIVKGVPSREARIRAIVLLGMTGGEPAIEVLTRSLDDPDIQVRYYAVLALGEAGNPKAAPSLARMRDDPDNARIRGTITRALEDLAQVASAN